MSSTLKGDELNYTQIDKQAYIFYKYVKKFRPYLMKSKTKVVVPYAAIRNVFIQKELGDK